MALTDDFNELLSEVQDDGDLIAATVYWNGVNYPCTAIGARRGGQVEFGGVAIDEQLAIVVRRNLFGSGIVPGRGETLNYRGALYRIDNVLTAPGDSFLRLSCVSATKGA